MSTTIEALSSAETIAEPSSTPGFWQRAFERVIAGQERRADAFVCRYLAGLNDETLAAMGYGRIAIQALRKRAGTASAPWM